MAGRLLCLAEEGPGQVPVLAGPSLSPTAHGRGRLAPVCPGGDAAREERDGGDKCWGSSSAGAAQRRSVLALRRAQSCLLVARS